MKHLKNSLVAFSSLLTIAGLVIFIIPSHVQGQKVDTTAKTSPTPTDVRVVNSATEPIPVTGTVSIGNATDSPVLTRNVNETALVLDQTLSVAAAGDLLIGSIDVSAFKQIRVVSQVESGSNGYSVVLLIPAGDQGGSSFPLEEINGTTTRTYDIPGQRLDLRLLGNFFAGSTVRVRVYGRSN